MKTMINVIFFSGLGALLASMGYGLGAWQLWVILITTSVVVEVSRSIG